MAYTPRCKTGFSQARNRAAVAIGMLCLVVPLTAQTFLTFDAPGAGTGKGQGTFPTSINQNGVIAGSYTDSGGQIHAFVRTAGGVITDFDPPSLIFNFVTGINSRGQIVGYGGHLMTHGSSEQGFLRNPNGTFLHISAPTCRDTEPHGINDSGEVAGACDNQIGAWFAFTRDASGTYLVVDAPGAGTGANQGTFAYGINSTGELAGSYVDAGNVSHGFIRDQFGTFTVFDVPGASGTFPVAINAIGEITGAYGDSNFVTQAFFRDSSGNITTFDPNGSEGTYAQGINDGGTVVGEWNNSSTTYLGFERSSTGSLISFSASAPDSTNAASVNNAGHITGYYVDSSVVLHGFLR
jgi:hypothetical protein